MLFSKRPFFLSADKIKKFLSKEKYKSPGDEGNDIHANKIAGFTVLE